jgi:hypothetical protein
VSRRCCAYQERRQVQVQQQPRRRITLAELNQAAKLAAQDKAKADKTPNYVQRKFEQLQRRVVMAHPEAKTILAREKNARLQSELKKAASYKQKQSLRKQIKIVQEQLEKRAIAKGIQRERTLKKGIRMLFPVIPASATVPTGTSGMQSRKGQGGRGRPRGTVKYSIQGRPVGVFEYRRYQSAQRQAFRQQLAQQQAMIKQQQRVIRAQAMPQYETQQYQGQPQQQAQAQLPPEMQGQGVVPEYSQFPTEEGSVPQEMQVQQQAPMPQQVPQYQVPYQPPQPAPSTVQQRPIAYVFRGTGNKPYPAVSNVPLTPSNRYSDVIEKVDAFTGERRFVPKPKPEGWIR